MPPPFRPARVLILAHRTADSPQLMQAVADRAARGPCEFTLLVPASAHGLHRVVDPEDHGTQAAQTVIVSMLPPRLSRWLRLDLPSKIHALGVPVLEAVAGDRQRD